MTEGPSRELLTKQGEKSERRKEKIGALMEKRHQAALAGLKAEEIMIAEEDNDEAARLKAHGEIEKIDFGTSEAGKLKKAAYQTAIEDYLKQKTIAAEQETALIEKSGLTLESKKSLQADQLGAYIFERKTNKKPSGKVTAQRQEAYFVLYCEDNADYRDLFFDDPKKTEIWNKDAPEKSGGYYSREFLKINPDDAVPLRCIVMKGAYSARAASPLVVHERQHFINERVFKNFSEIETAKQTATPGFTLDSALNYPARREQVEFALRKIKDELLARIRQGNDPNFCTNFFKDSLYNYLRNSLLPMEKREIEEILEKITVLLAPVLDFMKSQKARALCVNHLIDVPLSRFEEYLGALNNYIEPLKSKIVPRTARLTDLTERVFGTREDQKTARALKKLNSLKWDRFGAVLENEEDALLGANDSLGKTSSDRDQNLKDLNKMIAETEELAQTLEQAKLQSPTAATNFETEANNTKDTKLKIDAALENILPQINDRLPEIREIYKGGNKDKKRALNNELVQIVKNHLPEASAVSVHAFDKQSVMIVIRSFEKAITDIRIPLN